MTTTTNLALNQPAYNSSAWDVPLNANEDILDAAFGNTTSVALTNSNVTLTSTQCQAMQIRFTGTISANIIITVPAIGGRWTFTNATSGSYTVTIASAGGGSSVAISQGYSTMLFSDGTNIKKADDGILSGGVVSSFSAGSTGLTPSSGSTGSVTLAGTLNVANGGTGAATLTANNVLLGNGTSALQTVAPGTSGNVLTSNGTTWSSQSPSGGIGVGQTWQNVASSRSIGTTYTNSTSLPIMVCATIQVGPSASAIYLYINGNLVAQQGWGGTSVGIMIPTVIIPVGSTYNISGGTGINYWWELR
jgi:hypothetical protein